MTSVLPRASQKWYAAHMPISRHGRTDGQPSSLKINDGLFAVPVEGPERGKLQQFFSGPAGSEVCGPEFTPDNSSLFLAIQHPGEGGTFAQPISTWPDNTNPPRPSVVVIQHASGGSVGQHATVFLPNVQRG